MTMVAFKGHFDGRVIIPSEPVQLPPGRELVFRVDEPQLPKGTPGRDLLKYAGTISQADAQEMLKAIEEECERIDDDW